MNLYYTDQVSENDDDQSRHNCLRVVDPDGESYPRRSTFFCMSVSPPKILIGTNETLARFTFAELSDRNITSQQLYLWSAPIDVLERYQSYLDQSTHLYLTTDVFYNCTLPRFGPMCQYELVYYGASYSSLYEIIRAFYKDNIYQPTSLTCYTHLQCDRGPLPACLDWTEICDGQVDCLDGGLDEEHCWELEINECNGDEFQCGNGLCIPLSFYADGGQDIYECIDATDEIEKGYSQTDLCSFTELSFRCEDISCQRNGLTSSCVKDRRNLLVQAMFSIKDKYTSDECWAAFKCMMHIYKSDDPTCNYVCNSYTCIEIIEGKCPNVMLIPTVPILFGHIYLVYQKNAPGIFQNGKLRYLYMCYNNSCYDGYFSADSKVSINNVTCYYRNYIPNFSTPISSFQQPYMFGIQEDLWKYSQVFNYTSIFCHRSNKRLSWR